jgi:hypothetical protein
MSRLDATRGLWIGLGVALVLAALFTPMVVIGVHMTHVQEECIKSRGNWNSKASECTFNNDGKTQ